MDVVVDACTTIGIVNEVPGFESDLKALETFDSVIAPELYLAEIANALKKYVMANIYTKEQAISLQKRARGFVDKFYTLKYDYVEALGEGIRLEHSTYDMFYLILARRKGASLFTRDEKLFKLAAREGISVIIDF